MPLCSHGLPAVLRTVRKAGKNRGRQFYACPLEMARSCHFFLWKENNGGDVISLIEATQSSPAVEETKDQKSQLLDVEAKELVEWSVGVCVLVSRRWRS